MLSALSLRPGSPPVRHGKRHLIPPLHTSVTMPRRGMLVSVSSALPFRGVMEVARHGVFGSIG